MIFVAYLTFMPNRKCVTRNQLHAPSLIFPVVVISLKKWYLYLSVTNTRRCSLLVRAYLLNIVQSPVPEVVTGQRLAWLARKKRKVNLTLYKMTRTPLDAYEYRVTA